VEQVESGPAAIGGGGFGPGRGGSLPYVVGVRQRLRLWCALAASVSPVTRDNIGIIGIRIGQFLTELLMFAFRLGRCIMWGFAA
jgi:hypothetical protein